MLTPAITAGVHRENIVANNLLRHIRYNLLLDAAQSPPLDSKDLLENVSMRVLKLENVEAYTKHTKKEKVKQALDTGTDITDGKNSFIYKKSLIALVCLKNISNQNENLYKSTYI